MKVRVAAFACVLLIAAAAVTHGVSQIYRPAGWIVGGALLGAIALLVDLGSDEDAG